MSKFRKLPVVVEALQVTQTLLEQRDEWPDWFRVAWNDARAEKVKDEIALTLHTLNGPTTAKEGDYVVLGADGVEVYPVALETFKVTYEAVDVEVYCKKCEHVFEVDSEETDPVGADCPKCESSTYTEVI